MWLQEVQIKAGAPVAKNKLGPIQLCQSGVPNAIWTILSSMAARGLHKRENLLHNTPPLGRPDVTELCIENETKCFNCPNDVVIL